MQLFPSFFPGLCAENLIAFFTIKPFSMRSQCDLGQVLNLLKVPFPSGKKVFMI